MTRRGGVSALAFNGYTVIEGDLKLPEPGTRWASRSLGMVTVPSDDVRVPGLSGWNKTFAVPAARGMTVLVGTAKGAAGVGLVT